MSSVFDDHRDSPLESEDKLIALIDALSDKKLYSADHERIIDELASRRFRFSIAVDQVSKTYLTGLSSHSDGQTVDGHLAATDTQVQVQFPQELNQQISALSRSDSLVVEGILNRWVSGLDRLEFWGLTPTEAAAEPPDPITAVAPNAVPPAPPKTAADAPPATSAAIPPAAISPEETVAPQMSEAAGPGERPAPTVKSRAELVATDAPISRRQIIEYLAAACQVPVAQAAAVVDGFWNFLTDPAHYDGGRRALTLPHFGTFRLGLDHNRKTLLVFRSRSCRDLHDRLEARGDRPPDTTWIRRRNQAPAARHTSGSQEWSTGDVLTAARAGGSFDDDPIAIGRDQQLSLKRRIAVRIAQATQLDLDVAFRVMWELIETVTAIMAAGRAPIRWATRGEMKRVQGPDGAQYGFRTYARLSSTLPVVPALERAASSRSQRFRAGNASGSKGCLLALSALILAPCFYFVIGLIRGVIDAH